MARAKSVTKTDIDRALSTAINLGMIVSKIILKPGSAELIFGEVDEKPESTNDGAKPKEW